jgi:hypothetical protein
MRMRGNAFWFSSSSLFSKGRSAGAKERKRIGSGGERFSRFTSS